MSREIRIWAAAHAAGNAALLGAGYYWLGLAEGTNGELAWSALVAAAIALGACALYGASLAQFGGAPLRGAWRRLPAFCAAALAAAALYWLLGLIADRTGGYGFRIASFFTMTLRKPVKPATVEGVLNGFCWLLRWCALPALLLPLLSGVAVGGWPGFRRFGRAPRRRYWLEAPALFVLAFWLPLWLAGWTPAVKGFWLQAGSMGLRFGVAYLLFVCGWLALAARTSGGKPEATQANSVVSP